MEENEQKLLMSDEEEDNDGDRTRQIGCIAAGALTKVIDWWTSFTRRKLFLLPLINWVMIIFYASFLGRLMYKFSNLYAEGPWITMATTNILLYGLSDTLAQSLSVVMQSTKSQRTGYHVNFDQNGRRVDFGLPWLKKKDRRRTSNGDQDLESAVPLTPYHDNPTRRRASSSMSPFLDDDDDDEIVNEHGFVNFANLLRETPPQPYVFSPTEIKIPYFKFSRLARFMIWGLIVSPFQFYWYRFLAWDFPITSQAKFTPIIEQVACDQLIYSPLFLLAFFSFNNFLDGGDIKSLRTKLSIIYWKSLRAGLMIWPVAQFFNFSVITPALQIPFASTIGVFWNAYLSVANASS